RLTSLRPFRGLGGGAPGRGGSGRCPACRRPSAGGRGAGGAGPWSAALTAQGRRSAADDQAARSRTTGPRGRVVHRRSPAGRGPPVPGRSWAVGPRGARTTGLAGRAPRSSRLVSGPLGSWPVLSARGRSARGGSRSGRLGSFVRRGHQLLV